MSPSGGGKLLSGGGFCYPTLPIEFCVLFQFRLPSHVSQCRSPLVFIEKKVDVWSIILRWRSNLKQEVVLSKKSGQKAKTFLIRRGRRRSSVSAGVPDLRLW
jgi:hypothetical protein